MTDSTPYPVISHMSLDPLQWRLLRGGRRGGHVWPTQQPGTILVFQINDQFVAAAPGSRTMTGRLREATAVAVVSLHRCRVTTAVLLPSRWKHIHFMIEAEYDCQVVDAALMLQFGCWDVRPHLRRYLTEDPEVRILAANTDPLDDAAFQLRIHAHTVSRNRISPLYVPGMTCDLVHLTIGIQCGESRTDAATSSPNGHTGRDPQDYFWDE